MINPNTAVVLSPLLSEALGAGVSESIRPLGAEALERIISAAFVAQESLAFPYHNQAHVKGVVQRSREFADAACLSADDRAVLLLSAAYHDFGHCGASFRQLVSGVPRADLSNEEFAALQADRALVGVLSPCQRLSVQGAILATSFGQSDKSRLPRPDLYRPYLPVTSVEKLLALADFNNVFEGYEEFVNSNLALVKEFSSSSDSFETWLEEGQRLLNFVQTKLEMVSGLLPPSRVGQLQEQVRVLMERISALQSSPTREQDPWALAFYRARGKDCL